MLLQITAKVGWWTFTTYMSQKILANFCSTRLFSVFVSLICGHTYFWSLDMTLESTKEEVFSCKITI